MIAASSLVPGNASPNDFSITPFAEEDDYLNRENTLTLRNADTPKKRRRAASYSVDCIGNVVEDAGISIEANAGAREMTGRQSISASNANEESARLVVNIPKQRSEF